MPKIDLARVFAEGRRGGNRTQTGAGSGFNSRRISDNICLSTIEVHYGSQSIWHRRI